MENLTKYAPLAARIAAWIFVAITPLLLITSSARLVINLPALYSYGFDRYDIPERTRIERHDLIAAGKQIRDYFNNNETDLIIRTYIGGVLTESLYNAREIHHMRDVKALVQGVYLVQTLTILYITIYTAAGFAIRRSDFWGALAQNTRRGGVLTLIIVVTTAVLALVGFNRLFLLFHIISFSNDFWMLDPRRDYLIAMFPQGFFFDATMLIALITTTAAGVCAVAPALIRRLAEKIRGRRAP